MKLTLSHADLSLALCEFLASRGMTAFDPNTVTAEFSFKRGSKELVCELDSEPKPPVAQAPVAASAVAAAPVEVLTQAPEQAPEAPAQEPEAPAPQPEQQDTGAGAPAAGGDDDNLFD